MSPRRRRGVRASHELDGLTAASETAQVRPREVEAIGRELKARGCTLPPEIVQAVADAFLANAVVRAPRLHVESRP